MEALVQKESSPATKLRESSKERLLSLDALRGFDMFWIMGGDLICRSLPKIHDSAFTRGLAAQMEHCDWAGFHFYDLIFPLFVFLAGVSIPFSLPRMLERRDKPPLARRITLRVLILLFIGLYYSVGAIQSMAFRLEFFAVTALVALTIVQLAERSSKAYALERILFRSIVLFLLGVFYMGGVRNGMKEVYFAGVLHRIAGAYFFAALLFCFLRPCALVAVCIALLGGYWTLMTLVPVPGIGAPDLSVPGKNLAHYLDNLYLPGQKFEGTILSTLAAVANCLLGVFAGLLLKSEKVAPQRKTLWLFGAGAAALALGFVLDLNFPIIKLLWSSSYVLVACGYSAILLALFYQIIEMWNFQRWAQPFLWLGMNAITIYIVANIVGFRRLAERIAGGNIKATLGNYSDFVLALITTAFAFWLVHFLYRRKIFLRL
jgi:predicted acyltransferase